MTVLQSWALVLLARLPHRHHHPLPLFHVASFVLCLSSILVAPSNRFSLLPTNLSLVPPLVCPLPPLPLSPLSFATHPSRSALSPPFLPLPPKGLSLTFTLPVARPKEGSFSDHPFSVMEIAPNPWHDSRKGICWAYSVKIYSLLQHILTLSLSPPPSYRHDFNLLWLVLIALSIFVRAQRPVAFFFFFFFRVEVTDQGQKKTKQNKKSPLTIAPVQSNRYPVPSANTSYVFTIRSTQICMLTSATLYVLAQGQK